MMRFRRDRTLSLSLSFSDFPSHSHSLSPLSLSLSTIEAYIVRSATCVPNSACEFIQETNPVERAYFQRKMPDFQKKC